MTETINANSLKIRFKNNNYVPFLYYYFVRLECHAIVVMSACNLDSLEDMQDLSSACFAILRPPNSTMISDQDKIKKNSDTGQEYEEDSFLRCLWSAKNMYKIMEDTIKKKTDKVKPQCVHMKLFSEKNCFFFSFITIFDIFYHI